MENDYALPQMADHERNDEVSKRINCSFAVSEESSFQSIRYIPRSGSTKITSSCFQTLHPLGIARKVQQQRAETRPTTDAYEDEEEDATHVAGPKMLLLLSEPHGNYARRPKFTDSIIQAATTTTTITSITAAAVTDAPGVAATAEAPASPAPQHGSRQINSHSRSKNVREAQGGGWGPTPPSFYQGSLYWRSAALLNPFAQHFAMRYNKPNPCPTAATTTTSNTNDSSKTHNQQISIEVNSLVRDASSPVTVYGAAQRECSSWWCGEVGIDSSDHSTMHFGTESTTRSRTPASPCNLNEPHRAVFLPPPNPMNRHRRLEELLQRDAIEGGRSSCREMDTELDKAEPMLSDETRGLDTQAAAVCSHPVNARPFIRRSNGRAAALPSSTRDERMRYISGIVRLLLVPEALNLEERDVRRWIRNVNSLRRHAGLWADGAGNSSAQGLQQLTPQPWQPLDGINSGDLHVLRSQTLGEDASSNHYSGMRQRQRCISRVHGNSDVDEQSIDSPCTFLKLSGVSRIQWSIDREDESKGDSDDDNGNEAGRAYLHFCAQRPKTPSMQGTPTVFSRGGQMDVSDRFIWNSASSNAVGRGVSFSSMYDSNEAALNGNRQAVCLESGNDHALENSNAHTKSHGSGSEHTNGIDSDSLSRSGGKNTNLITSHGDRLAIRIASLKAYLMLMTSFLPLALFVGLSIFASSVAISGLFVVVLALLLGLVVYRHVVLLYTLCFSTSESGGWLLLSSSLLDLTRRFGGRPLFIATSFLFMATLFCAAVLFLSLGYVLTGGAIATLRVLWDLSTPDTAPLGVFMESPMGCQIDKRYGIILLLPFFLLTVCAAGPAHARTCICWWDTGLFRIVSIVQFAILFITTLLMQIRWTTAMSSSKFDLSLPFFHVKQGNTIISSLQWLDDDIFNMTLWTSSPLVAYIVLRLSLSVAQLSWLFTCGLSAVSAGTYHLYLVPLLWRRPSNSVSASRVSGRGDSDSEQQPQKQKQQQNQQQKAGIEEYGRDTEQHEAIAPSLNGVFMASGFGGPFSFAFGFFLVITLTALFVAFVGVSMRMPSLTAPLPVRLLWTAVDQTAVRSGPEDRRPVASCALGILQGVRVGMLRFAAMLSFLTGLLFFAWVPYFIVHVSSMLANLRPGAQPAERQALAASAFLRSKQAAAPRSADESSEHQQHKYRAGTANQNTESAHPSRDGHIISGKTSSNSSSTSVGLSVGKSLRNSTTTSFSPINRFMRCLDVSRGSKASATLRSVIFDLSSPFMSHPELYRATTRAGDGVRVADLFKHLRLLTLDGNWVGYHVAEVLLLRVPFLLVTFMGAAVLVAGRRARCYAFWTFQTVSAPSSSYICRDTSTPISDELYGRLVLFATVSGGLFVAPLVFAIPPFLLLRYWYEKRRCVSINARLAQIISAPQRPPAFVSLNDFAESVSVPFLSKNTTDRASRMPPLTMRDACGGLAGVRFFVAVQRSGEVSAPAAHLARRRTGNEPFATRAALLLERHRYATYGAPLPPSQYRREYEKKQRQCDSRVKLSCWVLESVLRTLMNAAAVVLSLCVVLLSLVGAGRAICALFDQYDNSSKTHQWTF